MNAIAICTTIRDAGPFIMEWIAFHRLIGVDRFVIYDEGSTDGTQALIARSRFARQVTLIEAGETANRTVLYRDFFANHAACFTWAAVLEQGDFLHPLASDTLRALLPRYEGFSAVLLQRMLFVVQDTLRHGQLLSGHNISRLPDESPLNTTAVTLVRVSDLVSVEDSPLRFTCASAGCDSNGQRVPPEGQSARGSEALIVNRYRKLTGPQATVQDRRITRFVPRLRAILHDQAASAAVAAASSAPAANAASAPAPPVQPAPLARVQVVSGVGGLVAAPVPAAEPKLQASLLLGIGVVTYNRQNTLEATLSKVMQHTTHPRTVLAVADDGSEDGTLDMLRSRQVLTVTGRNTGVAWNKNRALFLLAELQRCDVVILLEDDAFPERDGWEGEWIAAALRWGHVNVAAEWLREHFLSGSGTVDDPITSHRLTAQCAVFTREALLFGGYFDTRFRGYGHEHVEHTWRLLRMGYGGSAFPMDAKTTPEFRAIWGGIGHHAVPSANQSADWQTERNRVLAQLLLGEYGYRGPFQNEEGARQLREEMQHALPRAVLSQPR